MKGKWNCSEIATRLLLIGSLVFAIGFVGCSKDDNNPTGPSESTDVAGVWEGHFQSDQSAAAGSFCAVLQQDGRSLTGSLYIAGQGYAGAISGEAGTESLTFGVAGGFQFSGDISGNTASGTYAGLTDAGTWTASKTDKTNCDWAGTTEVNAFQNLLFTLLTYSGNSGGAQSNAALLASTITRLPTTSVAINGQQQNDWWICVWEVEDAPDISTPTVTLGAAISPVSQNGGTQSAVIWGTQTIHQQNTTFNSSSQSQGALYLANVNTPNAVAVATSGNYEISADSDPGYQNAPILVIPNVSPGKNLEVRTTTVSGNLEFTAVNAISGSSTEIRIPASGEWEQLEILHLRFVDSGGM